MINNRRIECLIHSVSGFDQFGQPKDIDTVKELVAVVKFNITAQHSTVRTDSSATHGRAQEERADVVLLFSPKTITKIGDRITMLGHDLRVSGMFPRFTVGGKLDHYQVEASIG